MQLHEQGIAAPSYTTLHGRYCLRYRHRQSSQHARRTLTCLPAKSSGWVTSWWPNFHRIVSPQIPHTAIWGRRHDHLTCTTLEL